MSQEIRVSRVKLVWMLVLGCFLACDLNASEPTHRLYDGINAFISNPEARDFTLFLEVRDVNLRSGAPDEMLVKVYGTDGRPLVRQVIPDDGVSSGSYGPPVAGWDHEAWYYETCYSRGLRPAARWSAPSEPGRLNKVPERTFSWQIKADGPGVFRVVLVGNPDLYVRLRTNPNLASGVAGSPEWIHGDGAIFGRRYFYVPRGAAAVHALFLQLDRPRRRTFTVRGPDGTVLMEGRGADGLQREEYSLPKDGALDERVLSVEVSEGAGDFLLNVTVEMKGKSLRRAKKRPELTVDNFDIFRPWRGPKALTAVLCPDEATARTIRGGVFPPG
jgi:hypothetical protein